jgi:KRAB domain-containing zinc finger protein
VHERRRPFACDRCPKQFGRKSFLQAHVLTVHEKRRPFACDHCGAAFGQRSSLTRHAKKIHGVGL